MEAPAVELIGVSRRYEGVTALHAIDLAVPRGQFMVLLGPSGSGKTTILSIIGGFVEPTSGVVRIGGADVTGLPPARRPTATVFQDYALFPHMSVAGNVGFGLRMRGVGAAERRACAAAMLELVGLASFGNRRVHALSGGQQQRVALARALAVEPAVLLLDEPLGALDLALRRQMQDELKAIQRRLGTTFVHVTHDQEEAMSIADQICLLNHGRIEDLGPPERVYLRPASLFAATFMGESNIIEGRVAAAAGREVLAETPLGRLPLPGGGAPGETVRLSLRPERIIPGPAEAGDCVSLGEGVVV
ncbi:MAG: ABC transporter ATP-binding protein, partial [Rhodospirillaceae bacterium]|nr:ABC transporter ATP-binding protein [Rhodospirillaceae bacterium]